MSVLVVVEHDRGTLSAGHRWRRSPPPARSVPTCTRSPSALQPTAWPPCSAAHGAAAVHQVHHDLLADYGPEAWGEAVAQAVRALQPSAVLACGTDRGNEVMAQAAARLDLPFVANCNEIDAAVATRGTIDACRGGAVRCSSSARCTRRSSCSPSRITRSKRRRAPAAGTVASLSVELDASLARTVVAERVERAAGVTLATAPLVVGGGRGVGSAEAFAPLEELAALLGGVVGLLACGHQQRLAQPHRSGRPDGHPHRSRPLHGVRHLGRHPALGGGDGVEEDPRDQHRPRGEHGDQGRLRGHRRPAQGGSRDHRRSSSPHVGLTAA